MTPLSISWAAPGTSGGASVGVASGGTAGPTSGGFWGNKDSSWPGTRDAGLTSVGDGRNPEAVGVIATPMGWVGIASGDQGRHGGKSICAWGEYGLGCGRRWVLERRCHGRLERGAGGVVPDITMVKPTARRMTAISAVMFRGRVCKVKPCPCMARVAAIIARPGRSPKRIPGDRHVLGTHAASCVCTGHTMLRPAQIVAIGNWLMS